MGFPIPGIVLVRQMDKKFLVLDGQQRLRTLSDFYSLDEHGEPSSNGFKLSALKEGNPYRNKRYVDLSEAEQLTIDNTLIQTIIIDIESTPEGYESVYQIFERLNAGGTKLTAHEIRIALYAGPFIDFLAQLNQDTDWRELYGKNSTRERDQELILRILAMYEEWQSYSSPLKSFLNSFAEHHRHENSQNSTELSILGSLFTAACQRLQSAAGRRALAQNGRFNVSQTEAILVGLMQRLKITHREISDQEISEAVTSLQKNQLFISACFVGTSDPGQVYTRIKLAREAFGVNDAE
jgi:hypothetical protein